MGTETFFKELTLGVCYYPEHWPEELWREDLRRMLKTGIRVVRVGEFAWNKTEPAEGVYTFDFFDRFLALAAELGMKVIFCTPTATPPAWASHAYPEILNADINGVPYRHGHRRHYSYNSPVYRRLTAAIVSRLAEHYAGHPAIIGWQIDNEINCEVDRFYSPGDEEAFREWLRERYGTLKALNDAWGAEFWNQGYSAWPQVHLPGPVPGSAPNPHQQMDYLRFISHSARAFVKLQSDILRRHLPKEVFITTNGIFGTLDSHAMTEEALEFITYDSYPNFAFGAGARPGRPEELDDRGWAEKLSVARSMGGFGIMEQQAGADGWNVNAPSPAPKPGQMTLWAMQSVAHGADFVSFFRWRTCTVGTEIYWHGILNYDSRDTRTLREAAGVGEMFGKLRGLSGAKYKAAFALVRDYDNEWDAGLDRWHAAVAGHSEKGWLAASQHTHTPMDYLYISDDTAIDSLRQYPVLVYPHPVVATPNRAMLLKRYVEEGGTLVLGCRSGLKNAYGHCVTSPLPGLLAGLAGCTVEEFTALGPADAPMQADWEGELLDAGVFNDVLQPAPGAKTLAIYAGGHYKGSPALVLNETGKGRVYYFGAAFGEKTAAAFLNRLGIAAPFARLVAADTACEVTVREKAGRQCVFILNYAGRPAPVTLNVPMHDLLTGARVSGETELEPYGVRVYMPEKGQA